MDETGYSQNIDALLTSKSLFNQQEDLLIRNLMQDPLTSHFMLHAILQQTWLVRKAAVPCGSRPDLTAIEIALERWKRGWESSMDTSSSSNSIFASVSNKKDLLTIDTGALLRVAYLMLCDDFDSFDFKLSLLSQCPETISRSIKGYSGTLSLSPRATRAAYCTIQGLRDTTNSSFQEQAFSRLYFQQLFFCESGRLLSCCTIGLIRG
jgi:hypothetical protein